MSTPETQPEASPRRSKSTFYIVGGVICCLGVPLVFGILAAIAVPNFLQFNCKSKQSEAKTNLSGLFTAEKAFYGEYNTYTSDLIAVNWYPDGAPNYVYGFAHPGPGRTKVSGINDYDESRSETANPAVVQARYVTVHMHAYDSTPVSILDLPANSGVTDTGFIAGAAGDIDQDPGRQLDVWTINENRVLTNVFSDCSN